MLPTHFSSNLLTAFAVEVSEEFYIFDTFSMHSIHFNTFSIHFRNFSVLFRYFFDTVDAFDTFSTLQFIFSNFSTFWLSATWTLTLSRSITDCYQMTARPFFCQLFANFLVKWLGCKKPLPVFQLSAIKRLTSFYVLFRYCYIHTLILTLFFVDYISLHYFVPWLIHVQFPYTSILFTYFSYFRIFGITFVFAFILVKFSNTVHLCTQINQNKENIFSQSASWWHCPGTNLHRSKLPTTMWAL
jgi:hypothetical protein